MKRVLCVGVCLSLIAAAVCAAQARHLADLAERASLPAAPPTAISVAPAGKSAGQPAAAEEATLAVAPLDPTSRDFETLAEQVLSALPKRPELRSRGEERARQASPVVVRPGSLLGRVSQALHAHPSLASLGSQFYRRCTSDENFVTSVRALCYARLIAREPLAAVAVPANVRSLARQIMD